MRIILLGAPGSGKGTQAKKLTSYYGIPRISTAEMVREAAAERSVAGKLAKPYLDQGQHVPDEIVCAVLKERLTEPDVRNGFLLVGFPKTASQSDALDGILDEMNLPLDLVLLLEGDSDDFMERLEGRQVCRACGYTYNIFSVPPRVEGICDKCGGRVRRPAGDNDETIANRMRIYETQSATMIQYYILHGKLRQIDAGGDSDAIYAAIRGVIDAHPPTIIETEPVVEAAEAVSYDLAPEDDELSAETEPEPASEKKRVAKKKSAPEKKTVAKKKAASAKKTVSKKKVAPAKKAVSKKKVAPAKKTVSKKKVAPVKKAVSKKKVAPAKKAATKKKATPAKRAATKKKAAPVKKAATKKKAVPVKKVATKKKVAPAKKATTKKKVAPAKKAVTKKKVASAKKTVTKKKVASAKKTVARKKTATKKKGSRR